MSIPSTLREWVQCTDMPDEAELSVVLVEGWDPVLAYRTGGKWYESPHDPIDEDVTVYLELRHTELSKAFRRFYDYE